MLSSLSDVAKEKQAPEVVCPVCGERHRLIKHGFYRRYLFSGDETIRIQRYRCYNGRCPRRTFSILPHPLLPVWRVPLCFLLTLLALHEGSGHAINALARATATTWSTLRRRIAAARRLRSWLAAESRAGTWGASPCLAPHRFWSGFTQGLSHAFFSR